MITAIIIGCEIIFWVFIIVGLTFRYLFHMKKTGAILLICTPLVDLVLLTVTIVDLSNGATVSYSHSLAAVYIGVSIGFGHSMIRWADVRFAYWFAQGPAPVRKYGLEHARHLRSSWLHHLLSWAIGCAILYGMVSFISSESSKEGLLETIRIWSTVLAIDFLISFSYTLWPRKMKQ